MKAPETHIRMQINDQVFEETGPADEVSAKLKVWLDKTLARSLKPIRTIEGFKKALEK